MLPVGSLRSFPLARLEIEGPGPAELLGVGFVTGSRDELGKLCDGYFMPVHPKGLDRYFMNGRFGRHSVLGAHQEFPAIDEDHAITLDAITLTSFLIVRRLTG